MKVLILGGKGESTNAVVNAISSVYSDTVAVFEDKVSQVTLLKKRIKKLGIIKVLGQVLFLIFVPPILKRKSKDRILEIKNEYDLKTEEDFAVGLKKYYVKSVNDDETIDILQSESPSIIIVNGTRIISGKILESINVPFVNMHVGITPKYRGVHGGYWAAATGDINNCGVTIHIVNSGIDTGDVIAQSRIKVTDKDNYSTYPLIQVAEGIKLELELLTEYEKTSQIETFSPELPSKLWSHPTIMEYLKNIKRSR